MTARLARSDLMLTIFTDPQPVPKNCWRKNCRTLKPSWEWETIRDLTQRRDRNRCAVCGGGARGVHEYWRYDEMRKVQTLCGFLTVCDLCHSIMHLGNWYARLRRGMVRAQDESDLMRHWKRVTGWDDPSWNRYVATFRTVAQRRMMEKWTQAKLPDLERCIALIDGV